MITILSIPAISFILYVFFVYLGSPILKGSFLLIVSTLYDLFSIWSFGHDDAS